MNLWRGFPISLHITKNYYEEYESDSSEEISDDTDSDELESLNSIFEEPLVVFHAVVTTNVIYIYVAICNFNLY